MASFVYALCALTSLICCVLLLRHRAVTRSWLLTHSATAFFCFALANALLAVDLILLGPDVDLKVWRNGVTLVGVALLLGALINASGRDAA